MIADTVAGVALGALIFYLNGAEYGVAAGPEPGPACIGQRALLRTGRAGGISSNSINSLPW